MIFNDIMSAKGGSAWGGKKYWVIFKNKLQASFAYRVNFFASFIAEGLSLVIIVYLWLSIYHQGGKIGNYTLGGLILYFIISKFINLTVRSYDAARYVGEIIRLGDFNNYLLKPLSFFGHTVAYFSAVITYNLIIFSILFSPLLFFGKIEFTIVNLFYFFISLIIAFFLNFLFYYAVGISSFFFGYIAGLNFMMWGINSFFSGNLIPIDLFPKYLVTINNFLPFKYMVFVPISIITNKYTENEIFLNLFFGLSWVLILVIFTNVLYKKGIKKYEAYSS
ncbi:MAG: hypothetical protein UT48_C0008G0005 [Parcubacteria group bacterium GW2011_GWE2_39_37]|uniref:ABC transporter permease n=1 Tax=Candidatus Falkowbacteria bacterium GW2011_GWF2_39_8 TaxID=1618642 RepID=A0A0G0Q2M6_9BACT|nr:MAG: hypothetical protein UT48_C0008G0005 [Parcubacteria group bacterium GW2011_GWE2_39_37]KKR31601.1 MAG: hypothetical protein UT64_C0055G0003 [Candidatus Falkowbacteria bacterium GW2011_GWF2_39_8]